MSQKINGNQIDTRGGAWVSWTPTKVNITIGSGSEVGAYLQVGKTVHFRYKFLYGSGSAIGSSPTVTLPVAPHANYLTVGNGQHVGNVTYYDSGVEIYSGNLVFSSGSAFLLRVSTAGSTYVGNAPVTATVPFTWGTSDSFFIDGTYEAA